MKQGKAPYVPLDDLQRAVAAQSGRHALRDQAILLLSHYLGLRAKELAYLQIETVFDLAQRRVRERIQLLCSMTKGGKPRQAFLVHPQTREVLAKYVATRSLRHPDRPLFATQKGCGFSPNTMQKRLKVIYQKAGIVASSHSGRRAFATRLIQSGADIYTVKELLGHASIVTTQEYFATDPERLRRMAALLE